ncbi:CaiB/BaiF CoA-transferase family protein [uncultured Clostridium sp.]|uniref:CaiB/BaiF CoA transferase family protein n=1 Tax=uncultured Clostridium sp. TaxID=59620 RepID=UPI0025F94AD2|nr:CoA transferase [uncultured Clostridium sp.]
MSKALNGVRVLDCANVIAGPYCASILSEFGAEVIKIEMPGKGDNFRSMGPLKDGKSTRWPSMGRNKKCITLDFHYEEGRKIFLELVSRSDVIIENFRTGTFDKWGLGIEELRKANPRIIVTHVTGYGQTGPNRELSGFGGPLTGFAGIIYTTGYPDRPPVSPSFSLADYVAGLNAVIGTMISLYYRDAVEGGTAQEVDVSLYEGLFRMQDALIADYDINGVVRERAERQRGASIPGGKFLTKDDKWVFLASSTNNSFKYLTTAMGRPELYEKYPLMEDRFKAADYIMEETRKWFAGHDYDYVLKRCNENKVALSPIYSIADIWKDPQYQARHNLVEFDSPDFGKVHIPSVCPVLTETPGEINWIGQPVGAFNDEIYRDMLGMGDEELKELKENGII